MISACLFFRTPCTHCVIMSPLLTNQLSIYGRVTWTWPTASRRHIDFDD